MLEVRLEYRTKNGSRQYLDLNKFDSEVNLGYMGIAEISLEPLASLKRIHTLSLQYNHLEEIDLSPISDCTSIREIILRGNKLEQIDLTPLGNLRSLMHLLLNKNKLQAIDLAPLGNCTLLRTLELSENKLKDLDLTPLYHAPSCTITLDEDVVTTAFVSEAEYSTFSCKEILDATTYFDVPVEIKHLEEIPMFHSVLRKNEPSWKEYYLFSEAMRLLELDWLGLLDVNVHRLLRKIKKISQVYRRRRKFKNELISFLCRQIDNGNPTIMLDIEQAKGEPRLARRIQKILHDRSMEIKSVVISEVKEGCFDLRPLWITAYGFEILESLEVGLTCDKIRLKEIERIFSDLGYELGISHDETSPNSSRISQRLKSYIYEYTKLNSSKIGEQVYHASSKEKG